MRLHPLIITVITKEYKKPSTLSKQIVSLIGPPPQEYGSPPTPSSSYGPAPDRQITITKNVYVHLPPEDPEDNQPPQVLEPTPPQKHYKLIFIKAPEPPKPTVPIIPAQPQDEHKTLSTIDASFK